MVEQFLPELAVLDVMMPKLTGIDVVGRLRAHPATRNVRIILISAGFPDNVVSRNPPAGADDYIKKPFGVLDIPIGFTPFWRADVGHDVGIVARNLRSRHVREDPTTGCHRPPHALGPRVVPAVPDVPAAAGRPARRAPPRARGRPGLRALHARRADGRGRRLPRDAARGRGRAPPARREPAASSVGPWYILMDEFLVSGETIVRDLQLGLERAGRFGGAMPVGLPARHVRPRRPDAPAPAPVRASTTRSCGGACPRPSTAPAFWWEAPDGIDRAGRVPLRRLRQRRRAARRRQGARRTDRGHVRRARRRTARGRPAALDERHRPPGAAAVARAGWSPRRTTIQDDYQLVVTSLADYLADRRRSTACPRGRASCARARAPTCSWVSRPTGST